MQTTGGGRKGEQADLLLLLGQGNKDEETRRIKAKDRASHSHRNRSATLAKETSFLLLPSSNIYWGHSLLGPPYRTPCEGSRKALPVLGSHSRFFKGQNLHFFFKKSLTALNITTPESAMQTTIQPTT